MSINKQESGSAVFIADRNIRDRNIRARRQHWFEIVVKLALLGRGWAVVKLACVGACAVDDDVRGWGDREHMENHAKVDIFLLEARRSGRGTWENAIGTTGRPRRELLRQSDKGVSNERYEKQLGNPPAGYLSTGRSPFQICCRISETLIRRSLRGTLPYSALSTSQIACIL